MQTIQRTFSRKGRGGYQLDADPADCILWDGNCNGNGYGRLWVEQDPSPRKQKYAHRVAWESWFGPIPNGYEVDHLCVINPSCINILHLQLLTKAEHRAAGNTRVTHCPQSHEYTPANTAYNTVTGGRYCRQCHRDRQRAYKRARRRTEPKETTE